jgi:hypothetical protein
MPPDVAALTGSVVLGLPDVQACLLLSRDGLAITGFPPEFERRANEVWLRLSELGDVRRGFVVVGDEMWAFAQREDYLALAIARGSARAALVLDRLDRMLEAAAEEQPAPATGGDVERRAPQAPAENADGDGGRVARLTVADDERPAGDADQPEAEDQDSDGREPDDGGPDDDRAPTDAPVAGVDAIALAREFAGLIPREEAG